MSISYASDSTDFRPPNVTVSPFPTNNPIIGETGLATNLNPRLFMYSRFQTTKLCPNGFRAVFYITPAYYDYIFDNFGAIVDRWGGAPPEFVLPLVRTKVTQCQISSGSYIVDVYEEVATPRYGCNPGNDPNCTPSWTQTISIPLNWVLYCYPPSVTPPPNVPNC